MCAKSDFHDLTMCNCDCKVCDSNECRYVAKLYTYSGIIALWKSIMCSCEELLEWHNRACIFDEYKYCGIETLLVYPIEEEGVPEKLVSWKRFAMETIIINKSEAKKKLILVYKSTISNELH